ncbi:MAG: glycosyltransferase family 92 protein [Puniceicoccales bacterium]|jgi:hypothetical protein|nr:glycosyltransferase family 92 protein [Puniceicoccales bacterium]
MKTYNKINWGVCAVTIIRENYLWLRDWVKHHIDAGVAMVVVYDNTGSTGSDRPNTVFLSGKFQAAGTTKRGENYQEATKHISDAQIRDDLAAMEIEFEGKFHVKTWQPIGKNGKIIHGQAEAYADFCRHYRDVVEWAAFLDCDEYIYLEPGRTMPGLLKSIPDDVSMICLRQHRLPSRWLFPLSDVGEIRGSFPRETDPSFPKTFARLKDVRGTNVHVDWRFTGKTMAVSQLTFGICHYRDKLSVCTCFDIEPRAFLASPIDGNLAPALFQPVNVRVYNESVTPISV